MRKRFEVNATTEKELAYSAQPDDWVYCSICASRYNRYRKLLRVIERKGSIIEIECRKCGEKIEVTI